MSSKRKRPAWWQLYVGLPLLCSLLVFEIDLHLDDTDNVILQLLILGLIFAFLRAWLTANRGAPMELDEHAPERQEPHGVRVYQFPAADPVDGATSRTVSRPLVGTRQVEVKGMLSTTFEIDAEQEDSVFQPRTENPLPEHALTNKNYRRPTNKES